MGATGFDEWLARLANLIQVAMPLVGLAVWVRGRRRRRQPDTTEAPLNSPPG